MTPTLATVLPILFTVSLAGCASAPSSEIRVISVSGAPKAAGAYSQGIVSGGMLYTASFTPRDHVTGAVVQGDITAQVERVFDSLEAVLKGAGCTFKDVVKVNVYLTDFGDFAKMNSVMAARFGDHRPARTTVPIGMFPGPALVSIDLVARVPQ